MFLVTALVITLPKGVFANGHDLESLKNTVEQLKTQLDKVQIQLKAQEEKTAKKKDIRDLKQKIEQSSIRPVEFEINDSIVHLAGYSSVTFADNDGAGDRFNQVQFSPIFHYQYKDLMMLESELEFDIGLDGSTTVALEYLTLDLFLSDYLTVIAGKFLSPVGQFRQNLHPGWINKLPSAPPGFGHDGATPISDVGLQLRGALPPLGNVRTNYSFYVANGPELEAITEYGEVELEGIIAEGFTRDADGTRVYGGRIGVLPIPELEIGISGVVGKTEVTVLDGAAFGDEPSRRYRVWGADFAWKYKGMGLRGEYVRSTIGEVTASVAPAGAHWRSWYLQGAYQFLPTKWEGVVRYTDFDSPHASEDQKQWAAGVNYLFSSNVIAKFAYEFNEGRVGKSSNDDTALLQMSFGF
ncbi:MAG TPA: porin [Rhodospirillales bacterium]|nr:porin [Rhodospirillales bacterium]